MCIDPIRWRTFTQPPPLTPTCTAMTDKQDTPGLPAPPAQTARLAAIGLLLAFAVALLLSILDGTARPLPSVALGAPIVLELERAVLGTALIAAVLVAALNLLRVGLPSKLSTSGVEWTALAAGDRQILDQVLQATREARDAIDQLLRLAAAQTATPESADRLEEVRASVERMGSALSEAEDRDAIADAIASLPESERMVVALYYYENLSEDEIAKVLRASTRRVKQLRTTAVLQLRVKLGKHPRLGNFFDR